MLNYEINYNHSKELQNHVCHVFFAKADEFIRSLLFILYHFLLTSFHVFLDPEGGSQNATLVVVVLLVLGISSLKIPKAFLIHSGVQ